MPESASGTLTPAAMKVRPITVSGIPKVDPEKKLLYIIFHLILVFGYHTTPPPPHIMKKNNVGYYFWPLPGPILTLHDKSNLNFRYRR